MRNFDELLNLAVRQNGTSDQRYILRSEMFDPED